LRTPETGPERRLAAAAAILILLLCVLVDRGLRGAGVYDPGRRNDFPAFHAAARASMEGDLPRAYAGPDPAALSPPMACLAAPLGVLPYPWAAALWVVINAALAVWIFRGMGSILAIPLGALPRFAGFLLVFRFLESEFSSGGQGVLVLALTLGAFSAARRAGDLLSGAILSAPILAAISPLVVLAPAVLRRKWSAVAGVAIGAGLLGVLLPVVLLGAGGARDAWSGWYRAFPGADPIAIRAAAGGERSQSLRAVLHALEPSAGDAMYLAVAAAVTAALLTAAWRRAPGVRLGWGASEIAAACAAMALLAPDGRLVSFVALWPAAVLGFEAWRKSDGKKARAAGAALWFGALVLVVGTSPALIGRELASRLVPYAPLVWAAALLLALVAWPGFFPRGGRTAADVILRRRGCG